MTRPARGADAEAMALTRTALVDSDHPAVMTMTQRVIAGADTPRTQAIAIHDYVRDAIRFGWAPAFYAQRASEVLASGVGYCNTKSTLFVAMLRAAGIPARQHFVSLRADILHGLLSPGTRYVDHSYTEVHLEGRWWRVDSYIVDLPLAVRARDRLAREGRLLGYGMHRHGVSHWDGRSDAFSQFVDDGAVAGLSDSDYGIHPDVAAFYAAGLGVNRLSGSMQWAFRWFAAPANRRIEQLRAMPYAD